MDEVLKEQIEFLRDCLNLMHDGNYQILKEIALETTKRLESRINTLNSNN